MATQAERAAKPAPRIYVLAGVNGAGKSSLGGAALRESGADYFNPDEVARSVRARHPGLEAQQANAIAWQQGRRLLEKAIADRLDFALESTLGGSTIPRLLSQAAESGFEVRVWYVGLATPELHIERVHARVRAGGHDIPEADVRRRWQHSRLNLIALQPQLAALRVYDNSTPADPVARVMPRPTLVLHVERGFIVAPNDLGRTPQWARAIVAAALKSRSG